MTYETDTTNSEAFEITHPPILEAMTGPPNSAVNCELTLDAEVFGFRNGTSDIGDRSLSASVSGNIEIEYFFEPEISVNFVQSVVDPDFNGDGVVDLVKDKPGVIMVTINAIDSLLNQNFNLNVEINGVSQEDSYFLDNTTKNLRKLTFTPATVGTNNIVLTGSFPDDPSFGTFSNEIVVDVHDIEKLHVGVVRLNPDCDASEPNENCPYPRVNANKVNTILSQDNINRIQRMYPLAPGNLNVENRSVSIVGQIPDDENFEIVRARDLRNLWRLKKSGSLKNAEGGLYKSLGAAVSRGYFAAHNWNTTIGLAPFLIEATTPQETAVVGSIFLFSEDSQSGFAHELTHALGQREEFYEILADGTATNIGGPVIGLEVTSFPTFILYGDVFSPPNSAESFLALPDRQPLMGIDQLFSEKWIRQDVYQNIMRTLKNEIVDPEVIIVSGILESDGTLTLEPPELSQIGEIDPDLGGDFRVSLLDANGTPIFRSSYQPSFKAIVGAAEDNGLSNRTPIVDLGAVPVLLSLPQLEEAVTIRVELSGSIVSDIPVPGKTNNPPTISQVQPFTGAIEEQPFNLSFSEVLAASDVVDLDGDAIKFRVESVSNGVLTLNDVPIVEESSIFSSGDVLVWTSDPGQVGEIAAFSLKAFDGESLSLNTVTVNIFVEEAALPSIDELKKLIFDLKKKELRRPRFFNKLKMIFLVKLSERLIDVGKIDLAKKILRKLRKIVRRNVLGKRKDKALSLIDQLLGDL